MSDRCQLFPAREGQLPARRSLGETQWSRAKVGALSAEPVHPTKSEGGTQPLVAIWRCFAPSQKGLFFAIIRGFMTSIPKALHRVFPIAILIGIGMLSHPPTVEAQVCRLGAPCVGAEIRCLVVNMNCVAGGNGCDGTCQANQMPRGFPDQPCFTDHTCAGDCECDDGDICRMNMTSHSPSCGVVAPPSNPLLQPNANLRLLQPLDVDGLQPPNNTDPSWYLAPQPGITIFFVYFNRMWPWILGVAAGISILQAMIGGIQIMMSAGNEQKSAGESRLMWALAGLILVALAGFILRILNPLFYR